MRCLQLTSHRFRLPLLALVILVFSIAGLADDASPASHSAILHGVVRDSQSRPVAGATVYLQLQGKAYIAHTNAVGQYSFSSLQPGTYSLRSEKSG
ncbi:MAG TPA: carboxypeptidase-like regulatory domain-containing protein, partial [Terriglobales bacterium]|nr:carboxypeptidase-like regulatory domain-containing protein [Terriglobales bacterium]